MGNAFRRLAVGVLVLCAVLAAPLPWLSHAAAAVTATVAWSEPVGEGVVVTKYEKRINGRPVDIFVATVDLTNPYVKIVPLYGKDGRLTQKQTVLGHARASGAVVAVNADLFHLNGIGAPLGPVIDKGTIVSAPGVATWPTFGVTKSGQAVILPLAFTGTVTAPDGSTYPLRGVNKESFDPRDGAHSHINQLNLYTPAWGPTSYGNAKGAFKNVVELVVAGGVVREVRVDQPGAPIPSNGYVLWGQGQAAQFLKTRFRVGDPVQVTYGLKNDPGLETAVGSHILLVDQGRSVNPVDPGVSSHSPHARAAVGIDRSGKKVWLVVVERSADGDSKGMTLPELANFFVELGAWKAINLDGGGSATMVVRRLAETNPTPLNESPYSGQGYRAVPTAIGVLNTAPAGEAKGIFVTGPKEVLAGDTATFSFKGYDVHYHPYRVTPQEVVWKVSGPGPVEASGFSVRFRTGGTYTLTAQVGAASRQLTVRVIGGADVARLVVQPRELVLKPGETRALTVQAVTKDGRTFTLKPHQVTVTAEGAVGAVKGLSFTASATPATGHLRVAFDGAVATVPVTVVPFADVRGHWALQPITALAARGMVAGVAPDRFAPDAPVTRAQLAVLLARLEGVETGTDNASPSLPFRDPIPSWAREAVQAMVEKELLRGYPDGTFRPDHPVTRAELAAILDRYLGLTGSAPLPPFRDAADIPSWAREAIARVAQAGVMKGMGDRFAPQRPTTRAEAATVLYRLLTMPDGPMAKR
ncbi:hypothetical protein JCM14720_09510 [Calditerricola yamamurae]